ncbi:ATP-binding protein [Oceanimonas sp. AH20CE76]|uniref:ATP-binding protein n=1 Tax=Oceanimonas sp. AH20CE76 TaxID=2977120 RepID=UPI0031FEDD41
MNQAGLWHQDSSYKLQTLELFNWGGFGGHHTADIHPEGTAVIGPTGSGKTTLVDALMTLLCTNPRYNLASTGGHESDRDLVSYVRGVSGPGDGSGTQSHIARPGKTVTGIAASLSNGDELVRIGLLLWFDDTSSAVGDMKRLFFFATSPAQTLEHWLTVQHEGGMRALRQLEKTQAGLWSYQTKKDYLARVRSFFDVRDNAFNLLNRAAGLKQLNSIDEIFRELVLDDTSAFDRAREVADSFDDLSAIHEELEVARRQQTSLEPVKTNWLKYQANAEKLTEQQTLSRILPVWFGLQAEHLWQQECQRLTQACEAAERAKNEAQRQHDQQVELCDGLKEQYLQLGGSDIESLEALVKATQKELANCERDAGDYQRLAQQLGLSDSLDKTSFTHNQAQLAEQQKTLGAEAESAERAVFTAGAQHIQAYNTLQSLEQELAEAKQRPGSNIRSEYQVFRAALAKELDLEADQLPFVAELVQVKESEQAWRGAIERAIGAHRLRILVPPHAIKHALRWVNERNNRLHVRLLEVKAPNAPIRFFDDGYTRKLDYKNHPDRETVKALLARLDRHCVDAPEQLRHTEHAMTQQGLMSSKARVFDKQDQKHLQDDWQTGFDNRDRLAALESQITEARQQLGKVQAQLEKAKAEAQHLNTRQQLITQLQTLRFEQIDLAQVQHELAQHQAKLQRLTSPDSDLVAAKRALDVAQQTLAELAGQVQTLTENYFKLTPQLDTAKRKHASAQQRAAQGLNDEQRQIAAARLPTLEASQLNELGELERRAVLAVQQALDGFKEKQSRLVQELVRCMAKAKQEDRGALSDVGTDLDDTPQYLERLQILVEEALPEKRQRFKDYLNRSSDEGVTQLLSHIDNEVAMIEERLEDVNATLRRTDFQTGCYLQLVASKVVHESLRSLNTAQKRLASARFQDDDGESQYKALQAIVEQLRDACERHRTQAARALLDPRFRIEFHVSVIERATGKTQSTFKGSQSGSGGEKEIIASYVLTASLSYALCPDGASQPLFGTIVLDEAFSRSSHTVAGRIIAALKEFGLHALFITPNKEMRLLRNHTRSAIVVHRRGLASSLITLSWQELDAKKPQRTGVTDEVTH